MYGEVLGAIAGIQLFPLVSLLLFVAVFSGVLVWAARADGARLDACAALPLADTHGEGSRVPGFDGSRVRGFDGSGQGGA
jgi:hypothetical protein